MNSLAQALEALVEILGPDNVLTDPARLSAAETATFATTQRVPATTRRGSSQGSARVRARCQRTQGPDLPGEHGEELGLRLQGATPEPAACSWSSTA